MVVGLPSGGTPPLLVPLVERGAPHWMAFDMNWNRFTSKVSPEPNSGCWLWDGSCNPDGYGMFWMNGRLIGAHRASAILFGLRLFDDCEVDHVCMNKSCVNPGHLEPVSRTENNRRHRESIGRISQCARGHELIGHNVIARPDGRRSCRQCRLHAQRARRKLFGRLA